MKKIIFFLTLLLSISYNFYSQTTNISGIINKYTPVLDINYCQNSVTVNNPEYFKIGDRVLMIQMKGAVIDTSNTPTFGNIIDIKDAGNYEFGNILKIVGNVITFQKRIVNTFTPSGIVQLIYVPTYQDVNIINTLTCLPWNGKIGGILAYEATGNTNMKADIDVSGKGFRGGRVRSENSVLSNVTGFYYGPNDNSGGEKGESIYLLDPNKNYGRGPNATGGGGGNAHNSGGGGGGNWGSGGLGGDGFSSFSDPVVGGWGGKISASPIINGKPSKLFLGGGGGAGEDNDGAGTSGGNGGGILLINSSQINFAKQFKIISNGENVPLTGRDGAGGGGAGGSISILCTKILNEPNDFIVSVNGGKGGDNNNQPGNYSYCVGTGGGAGGGYIFANFPESFQTSSGKAGIILNTIANCGYMGTYNANPGSPGFSGNISGIIEQTKDPNICNITDISGIINKYTPVTNIDYCMNTVTVYNPEYFKVGDRVMIIQMKGAVIDQSNSSSFGDILDIKDAGNYEFGNILKIVGNVITFQKRIVNTYTPSGIVQLIYVPTYQDVNIINTLTCLPWNGKIGGILAYEATGNTNMKADIDVSGKGFRGGIAVNSSYEYQHDSKDFYLPISSTWGAQKGEGIVVSNDNIANGMGKIGNGGGGGNETNAGGGGGGNYVKGGFGGYGYAGIGKVENRGIGGINLDKYYKQNRIFLGGGGGAGEENNGVGTNGGNGSGIVFIKTLNINKTISEQILANGISGSTSGIDGAGGGGAGGAILINSNQINGINISAIGGRGGDTRNFGDDNACHGPGGGGAGGILITNQNSGYFLDLSGGDYGLNMNPSGGCGYQVPYGATRGEMGVFINSKKFTEQNLDYQITSLIIIKTNKDTTICKGANLSLKTKHSNYFKTISWNDGTIGDSILISKNGKFICTLFADSICMASDTINVTFKTPLSYKITPKYYKTNCTIDSAILSISSPDPKINFIWNNNQVGNSLKVSKSGKYFAIPENAKDICFDTAFVTIDIGIAPTISILKSSNDTNICSNQEFVIKTKHSNNFEKIYWSDGSTSDSLKPTKSGKYYCFLQTKDSCLVKDSINVNIKEFNNIKIIPLNFGKNCSLDSAILLANFGYIGGPKYKWNTGDTSNTIIVTKSGRYFVTVVNDPYFCFDTAYYDFNTHPAPNLTIIKQNPDTTVCTDKQLVLHTNHSNNNDKINWNDGLESDTILAYKSGQYICTLTTPEGCTIKDSINVNIVARMDLKIIPQEFKDDCGIDSVKLTVIPFDKSKEYVWNNGSNQESIIANSSGHYFVTLKNYPYLCTDTAFFDININLRKKIDAYFDDSLIFSQIPYLTSECLYLKIKNNSNDTIKFNTPLLFINESFSIPQSQFSKTILPNKLDSILVCFDPINVGKFYDTLDFGFYCVTKLVKLSGKSVEIHEYGQTNCGLKFKIKTNKNSGTLISISPNPTQDNINIDIKNESIDEKIVKIEIVNIVGVKLFESNYKLAIMGQIKDQLNLSNLSSGLYLLKSFVDENIETQVIQIIK